MSNCGLMHLFPKALRVFVLLGIITPSLNAADVILAWSSNSESDLAGYRVYYGTSPGVYGTSMTIGNQTTFTIAGLAAGTYYFAVTAYNTSGLESGFSNEVSTSVTAPPPSASKCDLNADLAVNALDLQILINTILGIQPFSGKGDLNADGALNALDLQILGNVILGIRSCPL